MDCPCDLCGATTRLEPWVLCAECLGVESAKVAAARKAERDRISKEELQRGSAGRDRGGSLLAADADEQIGGQARWIRALEEGT